MAVDAVIKNGLVVSPTGIAHTGIAIDKGKIVAISPEPYLPEAKKTIDAGGKYVIPGFVDGHNHADLQWQFGAETLDSCFKTETKAAAVGGVTTIGIMPIGPSIIKIIPEYIRAYDNNAVVDTIFHFLASTEEHIKELPQCPDMGIVSIGEMGGYKAEQAEIVGMNYIDDARMYEFFEIISKWGPPGRAILHAENIDIIILLKGRIIAEGRKDCAAWTASRPTFCEAEKMKCYIELARTTKCPIYFVHMTIGKGVDIIAQAKSDGVDVMAETCPQYLTVTPDDFKTYPPAANVNPPLRTKEDVERLWQGIRDGWVQTTATDHAPWTKKQKGDDIMQSPMGVGNVLATWMPVMLSEGVNKGRITLEKMVEVCCTNPARWMGILPQKGIISIGSDADIVIIDMNKKKVPKTADLYSVSDGFNIYDILKRELKGWPVMTMVRGNVVMEDGKVIGKEGTGKYIKRKLFRSK